MKLEDQVCNLELSKRLKELGVKQDGCFAFYKTKSGSIFLNSVSAQNSSDCRATYDDGMADCPNIICFSFSVAELSEMLPCGVNTRRDRDDIPRWTCEGEETFCAKTEANAKAQLLIWLIEQGKVKP